MVVLLTVSTRSLSRTRNDVSPAWQEGQLKGEKKTKRLEVEGIFSKTVLQSFSDRLESSQGLHCVFLENNQAKFKICIFSLPNGESLRLQMWNHDLSTVAVQSNTHGHTKKSTYAQNRLLTDRCRQTHPGTCPSLCQHVDRHAHEDLSFATAFPTDYSSSSPQANGDAMRAELSEFSWCSTSTLSHHFFAQIFYSMTRFSLRNDTLLSVTASCFACHHTCSTAATRLHNMLAEWYVCTLFNIKNSFSTVLCMSDDVLLHSIVVLVLFFLPCIWQ